MVLGALRDDVLLRLLQALRAVGEKDPAARASVEEQLRTGQAKLSSLPAVGWAAMGEALVSVLAEGSPAPVAQWRDGLRAVHPDPAGDYALISAVFEVLAMLVGTDADTTVPDDLPDRVADVARAAEACGMLEVACGTQLCLFNLHADTPQGRLQPAQEMLRLAEISGRPHLIAEATAAIAVAQIQVADDTPASRLAAFEALELAVERVTAAQGPARKQLAQAVVLALRGGDKGYLMNLAVHLAPFLGDGGEALGRTGAGGQPWPARLARMASKDEEADVMQAHIWALRHDLDVDRDHLSLLPPKTELNPTADWLDWTVSHPAYLRAVPSAMSFFEERHARGHLLDVVHEVTHVRSLLGHLGMALTALRSALRDRRYQDWARRSVEELQALHQAGAKAPPIDPAKESDLFSTGISLELVLKAYALQDAWLAWMEGLALYGEAAFDSDVQDAVQSVPAVLRCLVDFTLKRDGAGGSLDEAEMQRQFKVLFDDVDRRWQEATEKIGPDRLRAAFSARDTPYLAGYLAVRGVVASWRARLGRPITGSAAFQALLFLTRLATAEAIPNLATGSERFAAEAEAGMAAWAARLAALSSEAIEVLLSPGGDGTGALFWRDGAPLRMPIEEQSDLGLKLQRRMVAEAFLTLTNPDDMAHFGPEGHPHRERAAQWAGVLAEGRRTETWQKDENEAYEWALHWLQLGSFLPVGRADARFYLALAPAGADSRLSVALRTAEENRAGTGPSADILSFPLPHATAAVLAEEIEARRVPRLQAVRLVDMSGSTAPLPWPLQVYRYGKWMYVISLTGGMRTTLVDGSDPEDPLAQAIRARLWPEHDPFSLDTLSRADDVARHVIAELDAGGPTQGLAAAWGAHLRGRAERILAPAGRREAQRRAARLLLVALGHPAERAGALSGQGFEALVGAADRRDVLQSLLRTGAIPGDDPWLDKRAAAVSAKGFDVFERSAAGWDVRPATGEAKT